MCEVAFEVLVKRVNVGRYCLTTNLLVILSALRPIAFIARPVSKCGLAVGRREIPAADSEMAAAFVAHFCGNSAKLALRREGIRTGAFARFEAPQSKHVKRVALGRGE